MTAVMTWLSPIWHFHGKVHVSPSLIIAMITPYAYGFHLFRCCNDDSESQFLAQNPDESTTIWATVWNPFHLQIVIGIYDAYLIYSLLVCEVSPANKLVSL